MRITNKSAAWFTMFASLSVTALLWLRTDIDLAAGIVISLVFVAIAVSQAAAHERSANLTEKTNSELLESEKRFRALFEQAAVGVALIETGTGRFHRINRQYCEIVGYGREEMERIRFQDITYPDDLHKDLDNIKLLMSGKIREFSMEKRYFRKDGGIVWVNMTVSPLWCEGEEPDYHIAVVQDITERKKAEEWQTRLTSIIENATDFIGVSDPQGNILYYNRAARKMFGIGENDDISKIRVPDTHPDWASRMVHEIGIPSAIRDGVWTGETSFLHQNGSEIPVSQLIIVHKGSDGKVQFMSTIARDITERKVAEEKLRSAMEENLHLQAQMLHSQKLESLGLLAGGIAHDFNNLLMSIRGNAEIALKITDDSAPARKPVEKIIEVVQRAAELSRQLLAYSGKGKFVIENINLSRLVEEMAELLKVSIKKKVEIRYQLAQNLPLVQADATQMRQVAMNLIMNAADAIGDNSGIITVSTGIMECDDEFIMDAVIGSENLKHGPNIYLEISDNGCGMDEETKNRIFDPFFTTKTSGRGLGLSAVVGIVRGHKGVLQLSSKRGEGTTFRILLPESDTDVQTYRAGTTKDTELKACGTVLLVDDEEEILCVTKMMLETKGFSVLTACDGERGVELFRDHSGEIDAVLLDLTMPKMNGEEAFREMKKIRDDVRGILVSGYTEEEITSRLEDPGFAGFLHKPYSIPDLVVRLQEVLGRDRRQPRPTA